MCGIEFREKKMKMFIFYSMVVILKMVMDGAERVNGRFEV